MRPCLRVGTRALGTSTVRAGSGCILYRIAIKISTTPSDKGCSRSLRALWKCPTPSSRPANMAAFSLVKRDSDLAEEPQRDSPELSVLNYHREGARLTNRRADPPASGELEYGLPGPIVLRLPDLTAARA